MMNGDQVLFRSKIILLTLALLSLCTIYPVQAARQQNFTAKSIVKIPNSKDTVSIGLLKNQPQTKNAEARLIHDGKIISSMQFKAIGLPEEVASYDFSGKLLSDKGFSGHPQFIIFHSEYPACDYPFGDVLVILQNNQLSYGLTCMTSANEVSSGGYKYIFPTDKGGKPDRLSVIYSFENVETKHIDYEKEIYSWDGTKFKHISGSRTSL